MTKCDIFAQESRKMKSLQDLPEKIKSVLPDFKQKKTKLGLWGSEQIRKLDFLGQEMVLMKMD